MRHDPLRGEWRPLRVRTIGPLVTWYSNKLGRQVVLDGELESDSALLVEIDPTVVRWCEHAYRAWAEIDGVVHYSDIDIVAERRNGKFFLREVKFQSKIDAPDEDTQIQLAVQQYDTKRRDIEYRAVTECSVRRFPEYLANCKTLLNWLRVGFGTSPACLETIHRALEAHGPMPLGELMATSKLPPGTFHHSLALGITQGNLAADIDLRPIMKSTRVWSHKDAIECHPNAFRC